MKSSSLTVLLPLALTIISPSLPAESAPKGNPESYFPEAEFVASDVFRSGNYVQPLWRGLNFEGHYFGGNQTDVGSVGASWLFRLKGLGLAPGFGVAFGSNHFTTTPVFSLRWDYEKHWFVSQGLILQSFLNTPVGEEHQHEASGIESAAEQKTVRPTIADGNHISARWHRLTLGGTWEHIQFREGREWKGGGRLAVRLTNHASALLYVLGPGRAEFRAGIIIHPANERD